ncbi:prematurely terminated mRNA decay factor-like protein [Chrysochromulina tobinii]|uniref:Prematurely terminated mRNA decay factor-like protein n=1 Tax=Chrysochromulina tobinii TaxID=1460289 RepID=A0A0M0JY29_9EUKA|nr:prematurely terminated mRNA decay factor-like protein [Chrysochromulina tobinii]|eukprot:KOO31561.1 prematurely terminated mRNA decay factor-like protein [Chrysochromulina sp. CCMP291]
MLWFLQRALRGASRHGRPCKVLLAALTNVAVDNVVEGLLRQAEADGEAEPDVVRVGSVRRIAAAVLPHSTHGKLSATEEQSTKRELTRELSTAPAAEQHALKQAIALIDSGRMAARARALHQFTVVGATCAATGLACMQGLKFDFVLLDECSQLTEPASLLPLYRLGCERLIAAVAIRTHLEERGLAGAVTVSTVDAFQGAERDVILVSTCLTATCGAPDTAREALRFIGDPRRLNVTLTRARHHLLVFGHADVLQSVPAWAVVLDVAASLPAEFVTGHGVEGVLVESSDAEVDAALAGAGDGVGVVAADSAGSAADAFDAAQGARADELQLLMAARREKLTRIELMGTRMHSELAAKMDVGVRVNPMLRNMYLSSNSNADESGGAASSGTEEGAAAAPADGGANTRVVVDLLEAGSDSDDGELGGCGPAAAAAAASDGSVASVSSRMGSTRDEVVLADEFDGGEAEQALELLDF